MKNSSNFDLFDATMRSVEELQELSRKYHQMAFDNLKISDYNLGVYDGLAYAIDTILKVLTNSLKG